MGLLVLAVAACVIWGAILWRSRTPPLADIERGAATLPASASICVAVRNEIDRRLEQGIDAMLAQKDADLDVIAVDDHSTDASGAWLDQRADGDPRLRVLHAAAGCHGKRAALAEAARAARGEWLLFTDADALITPDALASGLRHAIGRGLDALSLLPNTVTVTFWEQVTAAATTWLAYAGGLPASCNEDDAPVGLAAAGPYLLVRREAYEAIGGYTAIAQNVLVDVALARRLREHGFRYRYLRSGGCVEARMYRSLAEIWEGFGKNAFTATGGSWPAALAAALALPALIVLPWLALGLSLLAGAKLAAAVATAAIAAMLVASRRGAAYFGTTPRPAALVLSWLGAILWSAILLHSGRATSSRRGVRWKSRYITALVDPRSIA
jgi:hypothetical protein